MDKKRLIGTIIGVIMFAALIVSATYAWLSFTANVVNVTHQGTTLDYWLDFKKGNDLSDMPILISPTTSNTASLVLTAKRPKGSIADNITIYLTTTSTNSLSASGAVKYAICENECSSDFSNTTIRGVVKTGETDQTVSIFTGELSGTTNSSNNPEHKYYIYFWLDAETMNNSLLGQEFNGYIHAESTQDETNYG